MSMSIGYIKNIDMTHGLSMAINTSWRSSIAYTSSNISNPMSSKAHCSWGMFLILDETWLIRNCLELFCCEKTLPEMRGRNMSSHRTSSVKDFAVHLSELHALR